MPAARYYSSTSGAMNLTTSITSSDTSIAVDSTTGLPGTVPFTLVLDPGQPGVEEIVTVTNVSGLTLTITRGVDGSSATSHSAGVGNVRHMATARDFREPQEHIGASAAVHGITGAVVGTTDSQTLTNKTLTAPVLSGPVSSGTITTTGAPFKARTTTDANLDKAVASVVAPAVDVVAVKATAFYPGQTANIQEWSNGLGVISRVTAAGRLSGYATNLIVEGDGGNTPAIQIPEELSGGRTVPQVEINTRADDTADAVQIKKAGTTVAKFDKDGNLTSPTVTALQAADTSLDARLDLLETSAWTALAVGGGVAGTLQYRVRGKTVDIAGDVTGTFGAGFTTISGAALPAGARPSLTPARGVAYVGSGTEMGSIEVATAGSVLVQVVSSRTIAKFNFSYAAG